MPKRGERGTTQGALRRPEDGLRSKQKKRYEDGWKADRTGRGRGEAVEEGRVEQRDCAGARDRAGDGEEACRENLREARGAEQDACGGLGRLRAEFVDEIRGALRVRGGGENRAVVVLQNFQPIRDVGGVIFAGFERQFEVGAQERGAKL